jgi:hypothetical protein
MRNLLLKIQGLPEPKRKIIFWTVMVVLALVLLSFYIKNVQKRLKGIEPEELKKEVQLPFLEEELKKLLKIEITKIEMPEIDQEKLRELECTTEEASN